MDLLVPNGAEGDLRPLVRRASATCHTLRPQGGSRLAKHSLLAQAALVHGATSPSLQDLVFRRAQTVPRTSVDRRAPVLMMGNHHLSALELRDRKPPLHHKHLQRNPSL